MATSPELQELLQHLDHPVRGNVHLAWYGQLRAMGEDHETALHHTIEHFKLPEQKWYRYRFPELTGQVSNRIVT